MSSPETYRQSLEQLSVIRQSIARHLSINDDLLLDMIATAKSWRQAKESHDGQCQEIEMALDVVYDVDNQLRDVVDVIGKGITGENDAPEYVKAVEYGTAIQEKVKEVEVKGNERLEELYGQLKEALVFGVAELKRFWPVHYAREDKNKELLRRINKIFRREQNTDHFYDVVKIYSSKYEKQVQSSIDNLPVVISASAGLTKELDEIISDSNITKTIKRNIYKRVSKTVYDIHMKSFLTKFGDLSIEEKKKFLMATDKCYSMAKDADGKDETEVFMSMLTTFYFAIIDFMQNQVTSLEVGLTSKGEQAFENATRVLCHSLNLIDTFTGTFSMMIIKKKIGSSDAIDFSVKIASQFIKVLKAKSDSLKSKSQLHSHLFALNLLIKIETELATLKKVSLKLKPGIEKSSSNATKAYLYYCWAHVLAFKPGLDQAKDQKDMLQKYYETFQVYEKNLENVLETHKKYPFQLSDSLKVKLRKDHLKLIYPKYHQLLNDFLALKTDTDKSSYFKYYANDLQSIIESKLMA